MDSFDADTQYTFGHVLRTFMAFKDGSAIPPASELPGQARPDELSATARRLKQRGQGITFGRADQLELLVCYDDEALLCHTALDAPVSGLERFCNEYRWEQATD